MNFLLLKRQLDERYRSHTTNTESQYARMDSASASASAKENTVQKETESEKKAKKLTLKKNEIKNEQVGADYILDKYPNYFCDGYDNFNLNKTEGRKV